MRFTREASNKSEVFRSFRPGLMGPNGNTGRSRPKFVFVFGAENGLFVSFGFFSFSAENEFSFLFNFSISFQKCHFRWAENVMFATEP